MQTERNRTDYPNMHALSVLLPLKDVESSHVPLDSSSSSDGRPLFTLLQRAQLQQLQEQSKGGGRLEALQLTPMQVMGTGGTGRLFSNMC
jgi:hypothetical protein